MSQRTERIDELLRQEMGAIIARDIADPRIGFATITKVETTPDLRPAMVFDDAENLTVDGLSASWFADGLPLLRLNEVTDAVLRRIAAFPPAPGLKMIEIHGSRRVRS